jgi:hypothetical protein
VREVRLSPFVTRKTEKGHGEAHSKALFKKEERISVLTTV